MPKTVAEEVSRVGAWYDKVMPIAIPQLATSNNGNSITHKTHPFAPRVANSLDESSKFQSSKPPSKGSLPLVVIATHSEWKDPQAKPSNSLLWPCSSGKFSRLLKLPPTIKESIIGRVTTCVPKGSTCLYIRGRIGVEDPKSHFLKVQPYPQSTAKHMPHHTTKSGGTNSHYGFCFGSWRS